MEWPLGRPLWPREGTQGPKMPGGRRTLGEHGFLRGRPGKSNHRCSAGSVQVSQGGQPLVARTSLDSQGGRASVVQGKETGELSDGRADGRRWQRDPRAGLQDRPGCRVMQRVGVEGTGFPENRAPSWVAFTVREENGLGTEVGTTGYSHQALHLGRGEQSEVTGTNVCVCSVPKSRPTPYGPTDCNTPGFPVLHHLLEFAQIHVR